MNLTRTAALVTTCSATLSLATACGDDSASGDNLEESRLVYINYGGDTITATSKAWPNPFATANGVQNTTDTARFPARGSCSATRTADSRACCWATASRATSSTRWAWTGRPRRSTSSAAASPWTPAWPRSRRCSSPATSPCACTTPGALLRERALWSDDAGCPAEVPGRLGVVDAREVPGRDGHPGLLRPEVVGRQHRRGIRPRTEPTVS